MAWPIGNSAPFTNTMQNEENLMIDTPYGKKRWRTIREAFEQRDKMQLALEEITQRFCCPEQVFRSIAENALYEQN